MFAAYFEIDTYALQEATSQHGRPFWQIIVTDAPKWAGASF